jgi:alpha-D-xyloside xylohydrolase
LDRIPVYARAGSIVPFGPVKSYADAPSDQPVEIRVYPGADGSFALYDDSGDGYGYTHGDYSLIRFSWNDRSRTLSVAAREGRYASDPRLRVVCRSGTGVTRDVGYAGQAIKVSLPNCR